MRSFWLLVLLAAPSAAADLDAAYLRQSRELLKALVRLDTSNPPGNEVLAARYLKEALARDGIDSELLTSTGTRTSLIARLKGSGEKRPILLMCHTDVVPAPAAEWSVPPFAALEKEGYLYGRGTADIKGMCAVEASLLSWLKRSKTPLRRDVVFFAEADEESGGQDRHIEWLLREHGSLLDAEFGINEGGSILWGAGGASEIRVQAAEKEYLDLTLTARGPSGHASVPRPDNAVAVLARAVARLSEHRFAAELNPVTRGFLTLQRDTGSQELREAIAQVLDAAPGPALDAAADRLTALAPELGALLRDTVTPTVLKAGYKSNVIPSEAQAVLNARLLPGRRPEQLAGEVRAAIDDPAIAVSFVPPSRAGVGPMPIDTELYRALESCAARLSPQARVTPFMAAWTTDSQDLRARGTIVYGVDPPLSAEDGGRIHGADERLELSALDWYAKFLREIVLEVAAVSASAAAQHAR